MRSITGSCLACLILPGPSLAAEWKDVAPIFQDRCIACHSGEFAPLGLRLDTHADLISGSETGAVVLPGDAAASPLIQRIEGRIEPRMPLDGPPWLSDAQIAVLRDWVDAGAAGPTDDIPPEAPMPAPDPMADGEVTYDEVAQIFARSCIECHSDNSRMETPPENLRLGTLDDILAGGDRIVLIPGNAQASEIIRRVEGLSSPRMPFDGPPWLTEEQVALLRAWIDGGAKTAEGNNAPMPLGGNVRFRGLMTGPFEIDGAQFEITGATRIDDRPGIGQRAELRGHVGPDGTIVAERLRAR